MTAKTRGRAFIMALPRVFMNIRRVDPGGMSKNDDPVVGEVLGMIGDRPCEIVFFLKALELSVIQMDRIVQQLHLAVTEELLAVRTLFQRAGHDSPAAEGQHLLGNIPRPRARSWGSLTNTMPRVCPP